MENKLPIYTNVPEIREERKKKYFKDMGHIYANLPKLTRDEYYSIKKDFENGDSSALDRLIEKSLFYIVEDVAEIFARHEIDNILSIEDLTYQCIYKFSEHLRTFKSLPEVFSKYTNSVIQQYIFFTTIREYNLALRENKRVDSVNDDQLATLVDKEHNYTLNELEADKDKLYKLLREILDTLTEQQANVVKLYFNPEDPKTCFEISQILNISRGRVNSLIRETINKVRGSSRYKKLIKFKDYLYNEHDVEDLNKW